MRSGVTKSIVIALCVDETRAFKYEVDCSGVETAPLTNDLGDNAVGLSRTALYNLEYIPHFHTTGMTCSHTRKEYFWGTAQARLCRLSQSCLRPDSSRF